MNRKYDVIIIGAGGVGCMIARFLSRYSLEVLLIEKECDVGMGASGANTAIIHAGYDPEPGTLKAEMNVSGNPMWDSLAAELGFPFERKGDYVLAVGSDELPKLEDLRRRGIDNGVTGMSLLSGEEMRRREPRISSDVSGALWASTGGVCDPFAVVVAAAENAIANGVTVLTETGFEDFVLERGRVVGLVTNRGIFSCDWAINAAGMYSDEVMQKAGLDGFHVTPRRGEYYVLDHNRITIDSILFPVPSAAGKGILVTTTTHGNVMIGPNSHVIEDKEDRSVTADGLDEVFRGAAKLVPGLSLNDVIAVFAGLRPTGSTGDFIIEAPGQVEGFINLAGIESPGFVSSPAIAARVIELLCDAGCRLEEKSSWNPIRVPRPRFRDLSREAQAQLIEADPRYGRIICRCEMVTEGEIVAEIHAPIPARTYDAIKRRTWLGTGRCQGGFDTPRVAEILSRELGISHLQVTKKGAGSEILCRPTKDLDTPGRNEW